MKFLDALKERWKAFRQRRADAAILGGEEFARLAAEVLDLARIAARVCPSGKEFQERLRSMEQEMEELSRMARSPRFRLVSPQRRRFLRKSLLRSRDQLMASVSQVPAPTRLPQ